MYICVFIIYAKIIKKFIFFKFKKSRIIKNKILLFLPLQSGISRERFVGLNPKIS